MVLAAEKRCFFCKEFALLPRRYGEKGGEGDEIYSNDN